MLKVKVSIPLTNDAKSLTAKCNPNGRILTLIAKFYGGDSIKAKIPFTKLRKALYSPEEETQFSGSKLLRVVRYRGLPSASGNGSTKVRMFFEPVRNHDIVVAKWTGLRSALTELWKESRQ